jgi:hypothetical protein
LGQQRRSLAGRAFDDGLKYLFYLSPAFRSHKSIGQWVVGSG